MSICKKCLNILGEYTSTCSWSSISLKLTHYLLIGMTQLPFSFRYDKFNILIKYSLFSFLYATMLIQGYRNYFTNALYYYKKKKGPPTEILILYRSATSSFSIASVSRACLVDFCPENEPKWFFSAADIFVRSCFSLGPKIRRLQN